MRVTPFLNGKISNLKVSTFIRLSVSALTEILIKYILINLRVFCVCVCVWWIVHQTKMTQCPRAVMLTGIPDIMERETLQDLLEIHFQKNTNGGGEIEAFLYNPLGEHTSAVFGGVTPDSEDEEQ